MIELNEAQEKRISEQSLLANEKAYRTLCGMEVELEDKLETIRGLKLRIMLDIEQKLYGKK